MDSSSLVAGDATVHVDLPPAALSDPTAGVASALASRLLRWCPDLGGVLLSYGGVELARGDGGGPRDGGGASASKASKGKGKAGERASDDSKSSSSFEVSDYFAFVRVAALVRDALVFSPAPAMRLEGTVARVGGDYVGVLVLGVFSAAIGGAALSNRYELRDVEVDVEVEDGDGAATATKATRKQKTKAWVLKADPSQKLVEGTRVLFDVARVRRSDGGFLSVLGTLDVDGTGVVGASGVGGEIVSPKSGKKQKRDEKSPRDAPTVDQPGSKRKKAESKSDEKKRDKEKKKETKKKTKK